MLMKKATIVMEGHCDDTSIFRYLMLLIIIILTLPQSITSSNPRFVYTLCNTIGIDEGNTLFQSNLNSLLLNFLNSSTSDSSSVQTTQFLNQNDVEVIHGLYYCRGDVGPEDCHVCVQSASTRVVQDCPTSKEAVIWYEECTLRYSNNAFPPSDEESRWVSDESGDVRGSGSDVVTSVFDRLVGELEGELGLGRFYRRERVKVKSKLDVEGSVQCAPQMTETQCESCLKASLNVIPSCCGWSREWVIIFRPSCQVKYRFIINPTDEDEDEDDDDNTDQDEDDRDSSRRRRQRQRRARAKWRILRDFGISTAGATTSIVSYYALIRPVYRRARKHFTSKKCEYEHSDLPISGPDTSVVEIKKVEPPKSPPSKCNKDEPPESPPCRFSGYDPCNHPDPGWFVCEFPVMAPESRLSFF